MSKWDVVELESERQDNWGKTVEWVEEGLVCAGKEREDGKGEEK